MCQRELREKIQNIQRDQTLSSSEKKKRIQQLFNYNYEKECNHNLNCDHNLNSNYEIKLSCCEVYYKCFSCHIESCKNQSVKNILNIKCIKCNHEQKNIDIIPEKCENCDVEFGKNNCTVCNFRTNHKITHCFDCNECKFGKQENIVHCNICNQCFRGVHKCAPYYCQSCSICNSSLAKNNVPIVKLKCEHYIHKSCYLELIKNNKNAKCPICKKSINDMTNEWRKIKNNIISFPISEDMYPLRHGFIVKTILGLFKLNEKILIENNIFWDGHLVESDDSSSFLMNELEIDKKPLVEIFCNDCEKKSFTNMHFYGLECKYCNGFNTQE